MVQESLNRLDMLEVCPSFHGFKFDEWKGFHTNENPEIPRVNLNNLSTLHADIITDEEDEHAEDMLFFDDGGFREDEDDEQEENGFMHVPMRDGDGDDELFSKKTTFSTETRGPVLSALDVNNEYSYFDKAFQKNWAGPEHWKLSNSVRRKYYIGIMKLLKNEARLFYYLFTILSISLDQNIFQRETKDKKVPKERASLAIDFVNAPILNATALFAPGSNINLSKSEEPQIIDGRLLSKWLLPEDTHYSSTDLLSLFLKPQSRVTPPALSILFLFLF